MERRKFLQNTLLTTAGLTLVPVLTKGNLLGFNKHRSIKISAKGKGETFEHPWNKVIGGGLAIEGLRATWLDHLHFIKKECGFQNCRISGLFNQDMFVISKQHGLSVLNWHYVDDLLDRMLDIEVKPFVELQNKDSALNITEWNLLFTSFINHCIQRYGIEELRNWHFEVWNDPSQTPWKNSNKEKLLEFYRVTAIAVKKADSQLKVGAFVSENITEEPTMLDDLLWYCKKENLPVDFISAIYLNSSWQNITLFNKTLSDNSFSDTKIHLINWNSDLLLSASLILTVNIDCIGRANSLSHLTFTDISNKPGFPTSTFGGKGLINYQGIAKPAMHAFKMLQELGDELVYRNDGLIITRQSLNSKIVALLYHCALNQNSEDANSQKINVCISDLSPNSSFETETVDHENGNILNDWKRMGSPEHPTRSQTKKLKELAMFTKKEQLTADRNGMLTIERELNPWTAILLKQV